MHLQLRTAAAAIGIAFPAASTAQAPADTFPWHPLAADVIAGSPDGRFVVVRDPVTQFITLRDAATTREITLIDVPARWPVFVWSPDSRSLAFSYSPVDGGSTRLFVQSLATTQRRSHSSTGEVLAWTRTGELLIRSGPAWYLVPAEGGIGVREVARGVRAAAITPDGEWLLLQARRTSPLSVRNVRTGEERRLTDLTDAAEYGATISRDGRLVLFIVNRGADYGLFVAPLDTSTPATPVRIMDLTALEARSDILTAWWLDNGSVAVSHTITGSLSHLYRVEVDPITGTAPRIPDRITTGNVWDVGPWISPDNKLIAFNRHPGAAVLELATTRVHIVADSLSPHGWYSATEVLLDSLAGRQFHITALDVATGRRTHVATLPAGSRSYVPWQYVPARQEIVYFSTDTGDTGGLRTISTRDGTDRRLAAATGIRMLLVSPDGQSAVYTTDTEVRRVALESATDLAIAAGPNGCGFPLTWAPDSRRLLCLDANAQSLHVVDVIDGRVHALLPRGDQMLTYASAYNYANAAWSADGTYIALSGQFVVQEVGRLWTGVTAQAIARRIRR